MNDTTKCDHTWSYIGSKRQKAWGCPRCGGMRFEDPDKDAELRRLHEVNAELVEAVKAALSDDQPYIEKCKAAITKATGEKP